MKENGLKHSTRHADSPPTPELLQPTNPVPAFIARTVPDAKMKINNTVRLDLMKTEDIKMWDGKELEFFLIANPDIKAAKDGTFPGPTIRIPRGVVFHAHVTGHGQTPHTIHWHGIEPSAMNDGVGHILLWRSAIIRISGSLTISEAISIIAIGTPSSILSSVFMDS